MLIYLIGFMGCGKTTAGKKLANHLGYTFVDLDKVIETNESMTVPELFAQKGESAFREIERYALHSTFKMTNTIVATGGGAPCFFDNIQQMNQHGITLYIDMSPKSLADRVRNSKTPRPLLQGKTDDELVAHISNLLEKRLPFYTQSNTASMASPFPSKPSCRPFRH
jgi:shikimate kinase